MTSCKKSLCGGFGRSSHLWGNSRSAIIAISFASVPNVPVTEDSSRHRNIFLAASSPRAFPKASMTAIYTNMIAPNRTAILGKCQKNYTLNENLLAMSTRSASKLLIVKSCFRKKLLCQAPPCQARRSNGTVEQVEDYYLLIIRITSICVPQNN